MSQSKRKDPNRPVNLEYLSIAISSARSPEIKTLLRKYKFEGHSRYHLLQYLLAEQPDGEILTDDNGLMMIADSLLFIGDNEQEIVANVSAFVEHLEKLDLVVKIEKDNCEYITMPQIAEAVNAIRESRIRGEEGGREAQRRREAAQAANEDDQAQQPENETLDVDVELLMTSFNNHGFTTDNERYTRNAFKKRLKEGARIGYFENLMRMIAKDNSKKTARVLFAIDSERRESGTDGEDNF